MIKGLRIIGGDEKKVRDFGFTLYRAFRNLNYSVFCMMAHEMMKESSPPAGSILTLFREKQYSFPEDESFERVMHFFNAEIGIIIGNLIRCNIPEVVIDPSIEERERAILWSHGEWGKWRENSSPQELSFKDNEALASYLFEKAFYLPSFDCKRCGFSTCSELLKRIVNAEKRVQDCLELSPEMRILSGGKEIPLAPFIRKMIGGAIRGLINPLKGVEPGFIRIEIEWKGERDGS